MNKYISEYTSTRTNNYNLLRLLAAIMVLFSHCYLLCLGETNDPLSSIIGIGFSRIAVDIFFVISGFLVTTSLVCGNNLYRFAWNRIIRVYPALIIAVLFCVFFIGLNFTTLNNTEYLTNKETINFLLVRSTLLGTVFTGGGSTLPGVFSDNPYPYSVNGSLWTLSWEILMYAILFLIGSVCYIAKSNSPKLIGVFCILFYCIFSILFIINSYFQLNNSKFFLDLNRFGLLFFTGSTFFVLRNKILLSNKIVFCIIIILSISIRFDLFTLIYSFSIGYLVFFFAYLPIERIINFNRFGDYSYGIYIYAFPIQQSSVALLPNISIFNMFIISLTITFIFSLASWHLIEKKSLKLKNSIWLRKVHIPIYSEK